MLKGCIYVVVRWLEAGCVGRIARRFPYRSARFGKSTTGEKHRNRARRSERRFVCKKLHENRREQIFEEGKACYRIFIRSLLDITDNIVDGKIVHPKNVVRHDEDDAYLVVAADKGTATFSDIANEISDEYNHWLGDAFASGGSVGYDHKGMGITARGAWESVKRHSAKLVLIVRPPILPV